MTVKELLRDELIRASAAARLLGVTPRTIARWSDSGVLPQPVRIGRAQLRCYYVSDIEKLRGKGHTDE